MGASCSSSRGCTRNTGPAIEVKWRRLHDIPHLPEWDGPKCDSVGFFQHYGECWNDSLQMILLFTDGIKELTQPILFSTDITQEWVDDHIVEKSKGTRISHYMYYYLRALQRRFKRHYATEVAVRRLAASKCDKTAEEMRKAKLGIELFYRRRGINAIQSAMYGSLRRNANILTMKEYTHANNEPFHGQSIPEVDVLIEHLLKILGIDVHVTATVQNKGYESLSKEFINPTPFPDTLRAVRVNAGAHSTAFYICGGKHYFYDDNLGVIPFRWDKFLKASTYEGIEEFILADPSTNKPGSAKSVKSKSKTRRANNRNNEGDSKTKRLSLEARTGLLDLKNQFKLVYARLREGEFYFSYYPFIYIKNNLDEIRLYTISPSTGEPRFYTTDEVEFKDTKGRSVGTIFSPVYVRSDAKIANTDYDLPPSEIRQAERRGIRNSTLSKEYKQMRKVAKGFNQRVLTHKKK